MSLGSLQEERNRHRKEVEECEKRVKQGAADLNVSLSTSFDANNVRDSVDALKKALDACKQNNRELAHSFETAEVQLQGVVDGCREEVTTVRHKIGARKQQVKEAQQKSRNLNSQLQDLDVADTQLQSLLSRITKIDRDLEQYKGSVDAAALAADVERMRVQIGEDDRKMEGLEGEFKVLNANCVTEAEIENLKYEMRKRESEINKLKNNNYESFNEIFEGKLFKYYMFTIHLFSENK